MGRAGEREDVDRLALLCSSFWFDTHFSPVQKEITQSPLLPPSALPIFPSSFPQDHETIKYPLKCKKQEVLHSSSHKLGSPLGDCSLKEKA